MSRNKFSSPNYKTRIKIRSILVSIIQGRIYYSINELIQTWNIDIRTYNKYISPYINYESRPNRLGISRKRIIGIKKKYNIEEIIMAHNIITQNKDKLTQKFISYILN